MLGAGALERLEGFAATGARAGAGACSSRFKAFQAFQSSNSEHVLWALAPKACQGRRFKALQAVGKEAHTCPGGGAWGTHLPTHGTARDRRTLPRRRVLPRRGRPVLAAPGAGARAGAGACAGLALFCVWDIPGAVGQTAPRRAGCVYICVKSAREDETTLLFIGALQSFQEF